MKIETMLGAVIAAVIAFGAGTLALLTQEGVSQLSDVSNLAWVVLAIGASISFLKDFQALTTRRAIAKVSGSGNVHSPPVVGILAILLACFMLSGCGLQRPHIDSISDAIAVTAADVETAAQTVRDLCRNDRPGGPCADGAALSTDQKESLKNGLQDVLDGLSLANLAVATGNDVEAMSSLARTEAILAVLRAELMRLQN